MEFGFNVYYPVTVAIKFPNSMGSALKVYSFQFEIFKCGITTYGVFLIDLVNRFICMCRPQPIIISKKNSCFKTTTDT